MHLQKVDFCCRLALLCICTTLYTFHPLCSPVSSNLSDDLQPPRFNQPWSWYPPVGGSRAMMVTTIVTTQWIPASSTDHLDSAISNRMTSLLLLQVFLLLSCMLFIRFLICEQLPQWFCWKLSATDPYRKQPSTPSSILAICHRVCVLQGFYFHVTHHNFLPTAWSALLWPAALTAGTLKLPV